MSTVAIITARGGSKRIPRKNVRAFLGKPILRYPIEAALAAGIFDEVMVSTDDEEIAEIARGAGAKVPFMRSGANSNDTASTVEVLIEVLETYAARGRRFEHACCLYPTAPFVTADRLSSALRMLRDADADGIVPVALYGVPIWWALTRDEAGRIAFQWPEYEFVRSQDVPRNWHDCGQFYFLNVERFLTSKSLFTANTLGLEVPELEVQDIDTEEDWRIAEIKYDLLRRRGGGGG